MSRFAAVQARVNRACIRHLADASVVLAGLPAQAIFARDYVPVDVGGVGVSSSFPVIRLLSADVPASPINQSVVISTGEGAGNWRIAEVMPDGAGMTALRLERAP